MDRDREIAFKSFTVAYFTKHAPPFIGFVSLSIYKQYLRTIDTVVLHGRKPKANNDKNCLVQAKTFLNGRPSLLYLYEVKKAKAPEERETECSFVQ